MMKSVSTKYVLPTVMILFWFALVVIPSSRPLAVSISGLALFYLLLYFIVRGTDTWTVITSLKKETIILISLIVAISLIVFGVYISSFNFIPVWDNLNYWRGTLLFNKELMQDPSKTMLNIVSSINNDDYNQLLNWIMSFPIWVLSTWSGAMISELVVAAAPLSLLLSGFIYSKILDSQTKIRESFIIALFVIIFFSAHIIAPVMQGYMDCVPALLFVALIIALLDKNLPNRMFDSVFIGLGVCGVFLIRRWFVYGVIGLASCVILYWSICLLLQKNKKNLFFSLLRCVAAISVGFVFPLLIFFRQFVFRSFVGDYSNAYSSWTYMNSINAKMWNVVQSSGLLWWFLAVLSVLYLGFQMFRKKEKKVSNFILIISALSGVIISSVLFWTIQDFGIHHWYIIIFFIEIALLLPIFQLVASLSNVLLRNICCVFCVCCAVLGGCCGVGMIPLSEFGMHTSGTLTGGVLMKPFRQNDVEEKIKLIEDLADLTNEQDLVYFAAASSDLNASLALSALLPDELDVPFSAISADVDSRDGFNVAFFDAKYVVTSDPVSLHMNEENERVVVALNNFVKDPDSCIGRHYEPIKSYQFDDDVIVTIYQKKSQFEYRDINELRKYFNQWYKDQSALFNDRFESYMSKM